TVTMTEMIGHDAETAGHDEPKRNAVTMPKSPVTLVRNTHLAYPLHHLRKIQRLTLHHSSLRLKSPHPQFAPVRPY
ncbi:MAG: hypothetical protein Q7U58_04140, partial [Hydrogenophaga sp.]|nr:hypothetical protein [Hydrogenophaga sp.]